MLKLKMYYRLRWLYFCLLMLVFACEDDSTKNATHTTEANAESKPADVNQQSYPRGTAGSSSEDMSQDSTAVTETTTSNQRDKTNTADASTPIDETQSDDVIVPTRDAATVDAATPTLDASITEIDAEMPTPDAALMDTASTMTECPASGKTLPSGNSTVYLQHDGRDRSYILHVPPGVNSMTALPVVVDIHGAFSNAAQQQTLFSGWDALSDREGFLVVYPEGVGGSWNVDDECCLTAGSEKINDVGFLKAVIENLSEQTCIDKKRVFASGLSNGAGITHRLGCEAADVFAAIAPVSTDLRTQPCDPVRPISVMVFRGTGDTMEPYDGGVVGPPGGEYLSVGAKATLELWSQINKCTGTPEIIDQYCESYTECADGVEADLCSLPNVGHIPYVNNLNFSVIETAWKMFTRQPMK